MRFLARTAAAFSILAIAWLFVSGGAQAAKPEEKLKVGITKNFFQNFSETIAKLVMQPFPEVVKAQTGLPGEIAMSPDSTELCERMKKGEAHLGVFQGHEFFWASRKYPELKPLMLAVNEKTPLKAYLIVRKADSEKPISDMAGKTLAIPTQTRPFARLWVERRGVLPGKALHEHYAKVFPSVTARRPWIMSGMGRWILFSSRRLHGIVTRESSLQPLNRFRQSLNRKPSRAP
ncbi:MAG: PhnD/SsuA/transferrin family substrate-binding protein [Planctomycetaceae bacterium]